MSDRAPFEPPKKDATAFNCPACHAFASQRWQHVNVRVASGTSTLQQFSLANCARCQGWSFWVEASLVYPRATLAPIANADLSPSVIADYTEAGSIVSDSPRAACALLRLAIQKLCKELGEPGKNINDDIGALVKKGLSPLIQQALDVVRVVGNNAVHPGALDLKDGADVALKLFGLVNLIADAMISQPKHVKALFDSLPDGAKEGIKKRDGS